MELLGYLEFGDRRIKRVLVGTPEQTDRSNARTDPLSGMYSMSDAQSPSGRDLSARLGISRMVVLEN